MTPGHVAAAVLLAMLACAGETAAQAVHGTAGAALGRAGVRAEDPGGTVTRSALTAGLEAELSRNDVVLLASYAEGGLGDGAKHVEGSLRVGLRARPWLTVTVGARGRALTVNDVTRRWLYWGVEGRAVSPPFAQDLLRVYGGVWLATTSVNDTPDGGLGRGFETGLLARHPRLPLYARLAYRLDGGRAGPDGDTRHTVEHVQIGGGVSF